MEKVIEFLKTRGITFTLKTGKIVEVDLKEKIVYLELFTLLNICKKNKLKLNIEENKIIITK